MKFIKVILMLIGAIVVAVAVYAFATLNVGGIAKLDPKSKDVYSNMAKVLLETGDIAKATVRKVKVADGIKPDELVESLNSVATEMGIKPVGDLPLSKEVEARVGKKQRYVRVLSYCNPMIAIEMVKFSMAYGAYLPCRIVIMEDEKGAYWLYTLDLDMMIHGGQPLPPKMLEYGNQVKKTIYTMMDKAASGEF
jgi:uncharacterized protein (DUF302 family)